MPIDKTDIAAQAARGGTPTTLAGWRKRAEEAERELGNFKKNVVEKASEAAAEHGFCDEVNDVLSDLGLEMKRTYEVKVKLLFSREIMADDVDEAERLVLDQVAELIENGELKVPRRYDHTYVTVDGEAVAWDRDVEIEVEEA
jgi:hypothetical protein